MTKLVGDIGWDDFKLDVPPCCLADSAKYPSAQAELGRQCSGTSKTKVNQTHVPDDVCHPVVWISRCIFRFSIPFPSFPSSVGIHNTVCPHPQIWGISLCLRLVLRVCPDIHAHSCAIVNGAPVGAFLVWAKAFMTSNRFSIIVGPRNARHRKFGRMYRQRIDFLPRN